MIILSLLVLWCHVEKGPLQQAFLNLDKQFDWQWEFFTYLVIKSRLECGFRGQRKNVSRPKIHLALKHSNTLIHNRQVWWLCTGPKTLCLEKISTWFLPFNVWIAVCATNDCWTEYYLKRHLNQLQNIRNENVKQPCSGICYGFLTAHVLWNSRSQMPLLLKFFNEKLK